MSVRRQKNGSGEAVWIVDFVFHHPDGTKERVRRVPDIQTRLAGEELERQLRAELEDAGRARSEKPAPTMAGFEEEFLKNYVTPKNKPSEADTKKRILKGHIIPFFGELRLDAVGQRELDEYVALKVGAGLSKKTIRNHQAVLGRMLSVARRWGYPVPAVDLEMVRPDEPDFDFLTFEEADRLFAHTPDRWKPIVRVALDAGLRIGELRALRWEDIDLRAGRIRVRRNLYGRQEGTPKSGKPRTVKLTTGALAALKRHQHLRPVVFSREDGEPFGKEYVTAELKRWCRKAELRGVSFHALRHTCASHLVMSGVSILAVKEILGHADIQTTMRYAHLAPDVTDEAMARLEAVRGNAMATRAAAGNETLQLQTKKH